jgi:CBS domain-containing protein
MPSNMNSDPISSNESQTTLYSSLSTIIRRKPVTVPPTATVLETLEAMDQGRIGSMIVANPETGVALGIFTLRDLVRRVALKDCDLEQPIAQVMTRRLVTLKPHDSAHHAALTMARHGMHHVLVVDDEGRLAGVVSQSDLFSLQKGGLKDISSTIRMATSIAALKAATEETRHMATQMLIQGSGSESLMNFISTLNDLVSMRVLDLTRADFDLPEVKWCWIALGSEGRLEQTLSTDQDNGIIFEAPADADVEALRQAFLPFAQEVNRRLDTCGFPLCKGNIMAGNPEWCLSQQEWRRKFSGWMNESRPQALLNASIFFDFRPLYGEERLVVALRLWLLETAKHNPVFLRQMAVVAVQCVPPLGLIRDFTFDNSKDYPHTIDLKMYGSRPFVDAARILSLAHGVPQTTTAGRLRGVADLSHMPDLEAMLEAFHYIQLLRLRHQNELPGDDAGANRVNPDELNELDRHILKESFKLSKKLQQKLQLDYRL